MQCLFWSAGLVGCGSHDGVSWCPALWFANALVVPTNTRITAASDKPSVNLVLISCPFLPPASLLPRFPKVTRPTG